MAYNSKGNKPKGSKGPRSNPTTTDRRERERSKREQARLKQIEAQLKRKQEEMQKSKTSSEPKQTTAKSKDSKPNSRFLRSARQREANAQKTRERLKARKILFPLISSQVQKYYKLYVHARLNRFLKEHHADLVRLTGQKFFDYIYKNFSEKVIEDAYLRIKQELEHRVKPGIMEKGHLHLAKIDSDLSEKISKTAEEYYNKIRNERLYYLLELDLAQKQKELKKLRKELSAAQLKSLRQSISRLKIELRKLKKQILLEKASPQLNYARFKELLREKAEAFGLIHYLAQHRAETSRINKQPNPFPGNNSPANPSLIRHTRNQTQFRRFKPRKR